MSLSVTNTYDSISLTSNEAPKEPAEEEDLSLSVFDYVQFACTTVGFVANLLTLITLSKNGGRFSRWVVLFFSSNWNSIFTSQKPETADTERHKFELVQHIPPFSESLSWFALSQNDRSASRCDETKEQKYHSIRPPLGERVCL